MNWLSPLTAVYAALAVLPLFVLLYFLKLKRSEQIISSTLLWKRAVQDLQVNAPFQRIRRNILFMLQLAAFLLVLISIAWPVIKFTAGPGKRFVLLIDRSASMNAADTENSRLAKAQKDAKTFIESMRQSGFLSLADSGDQAMVIAFGTSPKVMCNFTSNKRQLLSAIDSITPTDGKTLLTEAITVARAFAQSSGVEENNRSSQSLAKLLLFSDGRIEDLEDISIAEDELDFISIGDSSENIAVTAMRALRSYENPEKVEVFATVANYSNSQQSVEVQLSVNGNAQAVKTISIPPRSINESDARSLPGKTSIDFELTLEASGVIELRQMHKDLLQADDAAWSVLNPPKKTKVLLVTKGNSVLQTALKACPIASLDVCSPAAFAKMDPAVLSIRRNYDCIVLDNVPANFGPELNSGVVGSSYLVFGTVPAGIDVNDGGELTNQVVIDWRSRHPVLNYVNLSSLFAAKCRKLVLPRDAEVLAEFSQTPAIAFLRRGGNVFLLVDFDVLESNWPFETSFVLFCYNAITYLSSEVSTGGQTELLPQQPIVIEGLSPMVTGSVSGPGFSSKPVEATPAGSFHLAETDKTGLYSLDFTGEPKKIYAVNLLNAAESDIAPKQKIQFSGKAVVSQGASLGRTNLALWPILIALVLAVVFLEWFVYNLKVRI
jgi:hypothetical protein